MLASIPWQFLVMGLKYIAIMEDLGIGESYRHNLLGTFIAQCILPHFSYSGEQYCLEVCVLIYCDRI